MHGLLQLLTAAHWSQHSDPAGAEHVSLVLSMQEALGRKQQLECELLVAARGLVEKLESGVMRLPPAKAALVELHHVVSTRRNRQVTLTP